MATSTLSTAGRSILVNESDVRDTKLSMALGKRLNDKITTFESVE